MARSFEKLSDALTSFAGATSMDVAVDATVRGRADLTGTPIPAAPVPAALPSDLSAVVLKEELEAAVARRATLAADLEDAIAAADASIALLAAAEGRWQRAERHTEAEANRLEHLREEAPACAAGVTEIEAKIAANEQRIEQLKGADRQRMMRERIQEVYAPVIAQLAPVVRDLQKALAAQQQAHNIIEREGLWGLLPCDELGCFDGRGGDDLPLVLQRWQRDARKAGFQV